MSLLRGVGSSSNRLHQEGLSQTSHFSNCRVSLNSSGNAGIREWQRVGKRLVPAQSRAQGPVNSDQVLPLNLLTGNLVPLDRTLEGPDSHLSKICFIGANEKVHSTQSIFDTGASEEAGIPR